MKPMIFVLLSMFSLSTAQADDRSLNASLVAFKKQSAVILKQLEEIEKIALGCETYRAQVEEKLVTKSKKARADLGALSGKLESIVHSASREEAERVLNQVGARLQEALKGTSDPENMKNVKFVLSCSRPGNPTVERKVDAAIASLQSLIKIHKAIVDELN